jgi:GNAT superfamily N-acetyltransferase
MTPLPLMTLDLARRLEAVTADWLDSLLTRKAALPGNPYGAAVHRVGAAGRAFVLRKFPPMPWANAVNGLREGDENEVARIHTLYKPHGLYPRFDLLPGDLGPNLARALHDAGFHHTGFLGMLYGLPPTRDGIPADGVTVKRIDGADPEQRAMYVRVYGAGFAPDLPPAEIDPMVVAELDERYQNPDFRLYLAWVDGQPAGVASLFVRDGIGYLSGTSTLAPFRGRGAQSAMIARRLRDASHLGCELVAAQASFGSVSQRNLERTGLRLAYQKAWWTRV